MAWIKIKPCEPVYNEAKDTITWAEGKEQYINTDYIMQIFINETYIKMVDGKNIHLYSQDLYRICEICKIKY